MAVSHNDPETSTKNGKHTAEDPTETMQDWFQAYRQLTEDNMTAFQRNMDLAGKMMPFGPGSEFFTMWTHGMQDFWGRMGQDPVMPGDMEGFRRMYETWLSTWTDRMESYMRTPEFASKSGKDLEAMSDLKKKLGESMETYWGAMHLPSSADMREIYHKLYLIERKLDEMDRHIRQASKAQTAQAEPKAAPKPKTSTRTRKPGSK
jgi:hypothetical protein